MVPVMLSTLSLSPSFAPNAVVYPQQRQRYREFLAAQVNIHCNDAGLLQAGIIADFFTQLLTYSPAHSLAD